MILSQNNAAEAIQKHENAHVCNIGQGEARYTKYVGGLNVAAVKRTTVPVTKLPL
jgi:hypothetical protein